MLSTNTIVTRKPIAITMGDPAGIGPEIIVKAFTQAPEITSGCFIVGEQATLQRAAQLLGSDIKIQIHMLWVKSVQQQAKQRLRR